MNNLTLGELIEQLLKINLDIWDQASQIKTLEGIPIDTEIPDKVCIGQQVRKYNARRSGLRWQIDKQLMGNLAVNDSKIDYIEES